MAKTYILPKTVAVCMVSFHYNPPDGFQFITVKKLNMSDRTLREFLCNEQLE